MIEEIEVSECPVSLITPRSRQLVEIAVRASTIKGAAMYGADLSRWPARMVDAVHIVEQERVRAENAMTEAEQT